MSYLQFQDIIIDIAPEDTFLLPYMASEFGYDDIPQPVDDISGCRAIVVISSTDVYLTQQGTDIDESTPIDPRLPHSRRESAMTELGEKHGLPVAVLRCTGIVGTGMTGFPHTIASLIYRGRYAQIDNNEAQTSLIHAIDVARSVKAVAGRSDTYNLTDGLPHTINDLALALAHRIDDKRLPVIKPRWARWYYGRRRFDRLTTNCTFSSEHLLPSLSFTPIDVVNYLNTHEYTESDI